ncbi:MAG: PorV/PorQ family protein [Ignavibacteriales bacterium]|nr:PorV/PorQ family protein [Ignavibacteriales bacterium]
MANKIKSCLLVFLLMLSFCDIVLAQRSSPYIAKYAGEFLAIGVGGRGLGMGGAQVAAVNDITSGYWNPAGLAFIDYPQVALMHEEHFGDLVNYNYGAVAIPFGTDMSFSISAIRVAVDGIPDTRAALYDANNDGILDILSDRLDYSKITEFSNADWAFYFTFAKRQSDNFYWGANVKVLNRNIAEYSALGIGFDLGAIYMPFENFSFGANLQDITTTLVSWNTGINELISPTVKVGAAYKINIFGFHITPAFDCDVRFENRRFASNMNIGFVSFDFHSGLEFNYKNIVYVRGGYNDVKQFSIGTGIKLPKLNIDYSYAQFNASSYDALPPSHRISLIFTLEEPKHQRDVKY